MSRSGARGGSRLSVEKTDAIEAVAAKYAADWPAWGHRKIAAMMRRRPPGIHLDCRAGAASTWLVAAAWLSG